MPAGWQLADTQSENGRMDASRLRKKKQMTEDGSCQLDGRFSPNVYQPAGLIAYSL